MKRLVLSFLLFFVSHLAAAKGVYLTTDQFLELAFAGEEAKRQSLWLDKTIKKTASAIMDRPYKGLRVRYWAKGTDTVWIMDEIGKEKPITIGVHIHDNAIQNVRILEFRESRGGEVKYPFFTKQFDQIRLTHEHRLSEHVDGITGATLSVWAVKKVARLALYFHQLTPHGQKTNPAQ